MGKFLRNIKENKQLSDEEKADNLHTLLKELVSFLKQFIFYKLLRSKLRLHWRRKLWS